MLFTIFFINFIYALLNFSGNLVLIVVGSYHKGKSRNIEYTKFFSLIGAINILHVFLMFSLSYIVIYLPVYLGEALTLEDYTFYYFVFLLIPSVLLMLIANGLLFIIIGKKNRREKGYLLVLSGIFFIFFGILSFMVLALLNPSASSTVTSNQFIFDFLSYLGIFLFIFSRMLFLVYCIKLKLKYIGFSAILLLISSIYVIISYSSVYLINI